MAAESLPERVLASDYGYLRIQVAPRRRARLSTEAASSALLEVIQTILERVPHGKQVKNLTLIGLTLLQDSEEAEIWCSMFQLLSRCKTISFRKCLCQPMTVLYILRAVRHVLELGEYEWSNLYVIPSCAVSISDESAAGFRAEMPWLQAVQTTVCSYARARSILGYARGEQPGPQSLCKRAEIEKDSWTSGRQSSG